MHLNEHASVVIKNTGLRIVTVYRPPPSKVNGFKTSQFLEEMESFLEDECLVPAKTIFLGDFNIHVDEPGKPEVARFLDTLVVNRLHQHIQEPTHISGHTIDLIISRPEDKLVSKCCVLPSLGSDHMLIDCVINCAKPAPLRVTSSVRNFKCMDKSEFTQNLTSEIEGLDLRGTADEMLGQLESSVSSVLDAHAPSQTRSRSLRPRFPWYNQEINDERCKRRRLERKWRKTRTDLDHVAYIEQSNRVNKLIQSAKEVYYNEALESSDCKNMFVVLNRLLNKNSKSLPCCDSALELSDSFARFFINKVAKIRQEFCVNSGTRCSVSNPSDILCDDSVQVFDSFKPVSAEVIKKTVLNSANKSCILDTLPVWLFKDNIDVLCNVLTVLVNKSFSSGEFPHALREAVVCPVLKKAFS
ncbi:uncharacterized protein [Amphiura filiformis]|uniref:uncharacterized protein n=1 Tax=Amphiura filiformis TaxID=82378 RepID=UPI003B20F17A